MFRLQIRWGVLGALTLGAWMGGGCATTIAPGGGSDVQAYIADDLRPASADDVTRDAYARQLYLRGLTHAQIRDYERAISYYRQALDAAPAEPAVLSSLAEAYAALDDLDNALYFAREAQAGAPENVFYHRQVAQLYLARGDTDEAATAYRQLLAQFPEDYESQYDLARLLVVRGAFAEALAVFERLLDTVGENVEVRNQMLQLQMRLDDAAGLEESLRAMVAADPTNTRLRRMLAEFYAEHDQPAAAEAELKAALEDNPGDVETIVTLADFYRAQGREAAADTALQQVLSREEATADQLVAQARALLPRAATDAATEVTVVDLLHEALARDDAHAEALAMLGQLRYGDGAFEEAGEYLYRSVQANPRAPDRWAEAAAAFLQAGASARAADVAEEGLILFPGRLDLLRVAGYGYMDAYRNDAAIARFEEAVEILQEGGAAPSLEVSELQAALGLLYTRTQDVARAAAAYRAAIAADARNALALNNFAYSLAEREEALEEALGYARRAVELAPENASYLDTLGWVLFKLGRAGDARERLLEAVATGQASAAVHEHLGDVYAALGRPGEARQAWQAALALDPGKASLLQKLERQAE